jgi:hypothetical protein
VAPGRRFTAVCGAAAPALRNTVVKDYISGEIRFGTVNTLGICFILK